MSAEVLGKQFHGTDAVLKPGDRVQPRSKTGVPENAASWRDTSQHVSSTAHLPEAARYGEHVYVVRPVGVIGVDPEYGARGAAHRTHPQMAQTYDSHEAEVVRQVSPEAVTRARQFQALPRREGKVTRPSDVWGFKERARQQMADRARRRRARS